MPCFLGGYLPGSCYENPCHRCGISVSLVGSLRVFLGGYFYEALTVSFALRSLPLVIHTLLTSSFGSSLR